MAICFFSLCVCVPWRVMGLTLALSDIPQKTTLRYKIFRICWNNMYRKTVSPWSGWSVCKLYSIYNRKNVIPTSWLKFWDLRTHANINAEANILCKKYVVINFGEDCQDCAALIATCEDSEDGDCSCRMLLLMGEGRETGAPWEASCVEECGTACKLLLPTSCCP
jgi:hypothetical protein